MEAITTERPQFFTATNLEWKKLSKPDKYKDIIIESLRCLVNDEKLTLYAFVIISVLGRNPLSIELRTRAISFQKLEYIHWNPVRAGLCKLAEQYRYSSAEFYATGCDNWGFLTHYRE